MTDQRVTQLAGELAEALAASRVDYRDPAVGLAERHAAAIDAGDNEWQIHLALEMAFAGHPANGSPPAGADIDPALTVGQGLDAFWASGGPTPDGQSVNGYAAAGGSDLGALIGQEIVANLQTDADRLNSQRAERGLPALREIPIVNGRFVSDRELAAKPWSRNG